MADTKNLGMRLIEGSDLVDPEVINDNFKKVDAIAGDYILESGISGEWWYRKWNSGRAECGIDTGAFPNAILSLPLGTDMWITHTYEFPVYPPEITFIEDPYAVIQLKYTSQSIWQGQPWGHILWILGRSSGKRLNKPPAFSIAGVGKEADLGTAYVGCYTVGKWR